MSVTMYAFLGFAMMIVLTVVLVWGKFTPSIPMIVVPAIFALIMHPSIKDLSSWVTDGLKGQVSNAAMFTFAIIFFGVMMDAGVFDRIVGKMMKGAKTVTAVCLLTVVATIIGHSDGSGATTFLIVIPPFLMIYKKMHMRPLVLMCLVSMTAGVMNSLPWGGPCGRLAAGFEVSATDVFIAELPGLVIGLACCIGIALYYAIQEKKRGAGLPEGVHPEELFTETDRTDEEKALLRPGYFVFNVILIVLVIFAMFFTKLPTFFCFMIGASTALLVNYPDAKVQAARLRSYAPQVLTMVSVLFAAGIFTGILNNSPMKDSMVEVISAMLQDGGEHINTVMGFLWGPLSAIGLNHEACAYTIVPMIQSISADHVTKLQAAAGYLMTFVPQVFVNPATAAMYIGLGLSGIEFKDHWKFSFKWAMLICTVCFAGSLLIGAIPF
jgi:CitMHS family citrate-Mg2+:H+ or citrate-Ca2+:H+ symporter